MWLTGVYSNGMEKAMKRLILLCSQIEEWSRKIFERLFGRQLGRHCRERSRMEISIGSMEKFYLKQMLNELEELPQMYVECVERPVRVRVIRRK